MTCVRTNVPYTKSSLVPKLVGTKALGRHLRFVNNHSDRHYPHLPDTEETTYETNRHWDEN